MYIELHAATSFSFLEGASLPEDLVAEASRLGYSALAVCDRDGVYGTPRFHKAALAAGVQPLVGCEISLDPAGVGNLAGPSRDRQGAVSGLRPTQMDANRRSFDRAANPNNQKAAHDLQSMDHEKQPLPDGRGFGRNRGSEPGRGLETSHHADRLTVLVKNRRGYQNLCRLLTRMHLRSPKGEGSATWNDLEEYAEGLVALAGDLHHAGALQAIFGPKDLYIEIQRHFRREQEQCNQFRIEYARRHRLPLLATNGVRYAKKSERALFDILTCIHQKTVLDRAGRLLDANAERYLKSPAEMARLFRDVPDAIHNSQELAARLGFTLKDLGYEFPHYPVPPGETEMSYLRQVTEQGARERYRPYHERAQRQIEHEFRVIEKLNLPGYFLIVWDMIRFCHQNKILAQGRGSAANSAVCYSLGITAVDPVGMELLFERFLSEERGEWPDIDIDLPSGDQREKVLQHVYQQYGPGGAGMTANVITYRGKSAVREVGKALGFPEEMITHLSKCIHSFEYTDDADKLARQIRTAGFDVSHPRVKHLVQLSLQIQNRPRHLGQHSGGMVICQGDLDAVVPLENARMPGRVVVQWDKDDCADLGIIKVDLLGLGMMAALEESIQIIRSRGGEIDLAHLPPDDPETYAMIQKADTVGTFQIESRAQMATLPRLKPNCFYDLVVEVAIIRPGPIVGKMVHPYINRRLGREAVTYPHPSLEPILKRTLGVPLFQEQLLRLAMVAAGFTGGEAEELRRAMGFKRSLERMEEIERKLRNGLSSNGIHGEAAEQIVRSITSFALYGFPESHAASFALLAYASCYLKAHYPAAFYTALLNCQPMGFYSPAVLVKDAQRHGIQVRPIDVQTSDLRCRVESSRDRKEAVSRTGAPHPAVATSLASDLAGLGKKAADVRQTASTEGGEIPAVRSAQPQNGSTAQRKSGSTDNTIRMGLRYVSGLRTEAAELIERERLKRPFTSIDDFVRRANLRKSELDVLAEIGALNSIGKTMHRRRALWQIEKAWRPKGPLLEDVGPADASAAMVESLPKMQESSGRSFRAPNASAGSNPPNATISQERKTSPVRSQRVRDGSRENDSTTQPLNGSTECPLAPMTPFERLDADYRGAGLTTGPHPMHYLREPLDVLGVLPAAKLEAHPNGRWVKVAGAVITRQRPGTAKGFVFLTLEDETGVSNVVVTPDKFQDNRILVTSEPFLLVEGVLQKQDGVIHVRAKHMKRLGDISLEIASHDFH